MMERVEEALLKMKIARADVEILEIAGVTTNVSVQQCSRIIEKLEIIRTVKNSLVAAKIQQGRIGKALEKHHHEVTQIPERHKRYYLHRGEREHPDVVAVQKRLKHAREQITKIKGVEL